MEPNAYWLMDEVEARFNRHLETEFLIAYNMIEEEVRKRKELENKLDQLLLAVVNSDWSAIEKALQERYAALTAEETE